MNFLNSFFLWLLPAAAIPVILHFLNRKPVKRIVFSSLKFLQPVTRKVIKKFRLYQLLLLLMRVLIIITLTLAFARPVWKGYGGGKEILYNIILIDNSFSTGYRQVKGSALELAKETALNLIDETEGRTAVGVINERLESLCSFTNDKKLLKKNVSEITGSFRTTDIINSVNGALETSEEIENKKNIFIISDFNEELTGNLTSISNNIRFLLIDVCDGKKNAWIGEADTGNVFSGIPAEIEVPVFANSKTDAAVNLYIENIKRNRKEVTADGKNSVVFSHTFFNRPGEYYGCVELEADTNYDRIDEDNRSYFKINVQKRSNILLVDGSPGYTLLESGSYFLAKALSPSGCKTSAVPRITNPEQLMETDLSVYDAVFLLNVALNGNIRQKVLQFVNSGGGLAVFAGDNFNINEYNLLLSAIMPVKIISFDRAGKQVELHAKDIFSDIFSNSRAKFTGILKTEGGSNEQPKIMAGKTPLLWLYAPEERQSGKTAFYTSSADMSWNNLPVKPSYPAFIHELADFFRSGAKGSEMYFVGETIPGRADAGITFHSLTSEKFLSDFSVAKMPGIYSREGKIYPVNLLKDPESKLISVNEKALKEKFGKAEITYIPFTDNLKSEITKKITGEEKSGFFLAAAFILLAGEEILRKRLQRHAQ